MLSSLFLLSPCSQALCCLPPQSWREPGPRLEVVLTLANLSTALQDLGHFREARTAAALLLHAGGEDMPAELARKFQKRVRQCR